MLLLSWHGTILRVDAAQNRLTQAPPVPVRPTGRDFTFDVPEGGLTLPLIVEDGVELVAAPQPGAVHLKRGAMYLCAAPNAVFPAFDRDSARQWETFLPLTEAEAALLRAVLASAWRDTAAADDGTALVFALRPGFLLCAGTLELDLTQARPTLGRDAMLQLPLADGPRALRPVAVPPQPPEIHLPRTPPPPRETVAESPEAFRATPGSALVVPGGDEFYAPPLTPQLADRDWAVEKSWPGPPLFGTFPCQGRVVHDAGVFVLMQRGVEGLVFNTAGVLSEPGYLDNLQPPPPPHLAREGREVFLSAAALQGAPRLQGPHALFYGGNLVNHMHWLTGGIVPLCMMLPYLPPDTTLLLPASLGGFAAGPGAGKLDVLEAMGFGDMQRVLVEAPVCLVDDLYRPEALHLHLLPAAALQAARARAFARLPPAGPATRRIFLRPDPPRDIANQRAVETAVRKRGLDIVALGEMSFVEQIELFRHASLVVGVYGGALANILFCPPGTAVLELSPACQFHQQYSMMASKLNLVHGVLPCATLRDQFNGKLRVDTDRLRAMITFLGLRAGAPDAEAGA